MKIQADAMLIKAGLDLLFEPGQIIEVRALLKSKHRTDVFYSEDHEATARVIKTLSDKNLFDGIYYVLNPFSRDVLARYAANQIHEYARTTVSDSEILRRCWLLFDFDPRRLSGISATEKEVQRALARAAECRGWLIDTFGFPEPIVCISGNGGHDVFRMDEPNDKETTELFRSILATVAERFSDNAVEVDCSVYNASRITKAYGSLTRKGLSTEERPHRFSEIVSVPNRLGIATPEALAACARARKSATTGSGKAANRGEDDCGLPIPKGVNLRDVLASKLTLAEAYQHNGTTYHPYHGLCGLHGKSQPCLVQGTLHTGQEHNTRQCAFAEREGRFWHSCFDSDCRASISKTRKAVAALGLADVLLLAGRDGDSKAKAKAIIKCFSEITPQPMRWLWKGRIPLGKLSLLIGDPGLGKSLATIDLASRVTRGSLLPDGERCQPGSVIFLSAEDDPGDTIRPRLDAAGADVSRVHLLEAVRVPLHDGTVTEKSFSLETDMAALEEVLAQYPDVRLIVIDPVSAYLGGIESHSNAEVRGLLAPLAALAARYSVAILCVTHLRKSSGSAVHRSIASIAFAAAARAVWAVAPDPDEPERRLVLPVKQNLSADMGGLSFRVEAHNETARLNWEPGAVHVEANDVLGGFESREDRSALNEAQSWLRELLADGQVSVKKVRTEANAAGLSWHTVRDAAASLGVRKSKTGFASGWEWELAEDAAPEDAAPQRGNNGTFEHVSEDKGNRSYPNPEDAVNGAFVENGTFGNGAPCEPHAAPPPTPIPCPFCSEIPPSRVALSQHLRAMHSQGAE